jgi:hypothetical protein
MYMMNGQIFDLTAPVTTVLKSVKGSVRIIELILNTSVRVMVTLWSEDEKPTDSRVYLIEQPDYGQWGESDEFIVDYVKAKLAEES